MSALVLAAALATAVVGCSDDGGDDAAAPDVAEQAVEAGEAVVVDEVPRLADPVGVFEDLEVESCDVAPGPVAANGTITNTADETSDVVIEVRWVRVEGNSVLDGATVVVDDLAPDASAEWAVDGTVPDDEDAQCTYTVHRGQLG